MTHIYIAITVSILYILLKMILDKTDTTTDKTKTDKNKEKTIFRDSFYIGVIVVVVLYGYEYYFSNRGEKTKVFTNEPDF